MESTRMKGNFTETGFKQFIRDAIIRKTKNDVTGQTECNC